MQQREYQFTENAGVFDVNGDKVGTIDRVVIDPRTKQVTHVVIHEGVLFTESKVVPVEWLDYTTEEKIILKMSEENVDKLPPFKETHYIPWHETNMGGRAQPKAYAAPYYWYPPADVYWWGDPGYRTYFGFNEPPFATFTEHHIPEGTVPLKEGAQVISADNEHVGDIEQVFADPDSDRATHFVISQGMIFKDKKLVPTAWIDKLRTDKVYLDVDSEFLDRLANYNN